MIRFNSFMSCSRFSSRGILFVLAALIWSGCVNQEKADSYADAPNMLSDAEEAAGWRLLFDGQTTEGWRGYNQPDFPSTGWWVEDGLLIVGNTGTGEQGSGGSIVTEESFDDFELTVDFLLQDTSNSGLLYRVVENDADPIWANAPEYQFIDDATYLETLGEDWGPTHRTGDNYDLRSSTVRAMNPIGEWNTARIIVNGSHVEHWLNGLKTVEYEFWSDEWNDLVANSKFAQYPDYGQARSGPIGLQDHGHRVQFRNIKIREL
ncbi:MAG: DUF1080 domain-containing protein [Rhodothermales bacterium]|nr:DUF1080 domain-containing protein [Rhodothermales bacterium]